MGFHISLHPVDSNTTKSSGKFNLFLKFQCYGILASYMVQVRSCRHMTKAAFSVRLPISWNKLPMEMVNAPTLNTFKRLLDLAWFSLFPSLP